MTTLEQVRGSNLVGLMAPAECEMLAAEAGDVSPEQAIVEIGSYRGLSSAYLAAGAAAGRGARVTCIDLWPQPAADEPDREHAERQRGALSAFLSVQTALGWPVTALRARAVDVAPMWLQPIGLLFHDAAHDYAAVTADLAAWLPHLADGAVLALHDYLGDEGEPTDVARVVNDMLGAWDGVLVEKMWLGRLRRL